MIISASQFVGGLGGLTTLIIFIIIFFLNSFLLRSSKGYKNLWINLS